MTNKVIDPTVIIRYAWMLKDLPAQIIIKSDKAVSKLHKVNLL